MGLRPTKGVLLHGPPGTGKTSLARLCANDAGVNLFTVNGPEIVSRNYGKSEQALLAVFDSDVSCQCASPAVEVHPQLPGPDDTMHERPAGKVGMYTRFFDYANYRIPFSNFFVSVLIHFRIPFSQLSVFGSAKLGINWFSGSNISKDRAPAASEYNAEHASILITHASPFLRFPEEFLCWVGISRNYLLNKDTYPRFEYESGEEMDLNAFIRTADPRKVRIVERTRTENEEPIVTVAKHRTMTPLPTSVVRPSGDLSESVEREFGGDVSGSAGRGQEDASVGGYSDAEPIVPVTAGVAAETGSSRAKRPKKKRVPPRGSWFYPILPIIQVLNLRKPEVNSYSIFYLLKTAATTVTTSVSVAATMVVALTDVNKDKNVPTPSIFVVSSSSEKTDRTLSLFAGRPGSDFAAGSIRAEGDVDTSLQEVYIPEWTVTKGFELNDGRSCANMIDHFTPSLSSKLMRAEYNILEKRKWRSLTEERNDLLQVKDKEIEELNSLRGEVASTKEHKGLLEQERSALNLKVTSLEFTIAEKDRELSDLETSSSSLRSHNQRLVDQVLELETSSAGLREKLETYERSMKQQEEFQDNLINPLKARLAEIDADFTRSSTSSQGGDGC
ncbi:gypsy type transposase [Tanacetum coccineum]